MATQDGYSREYTSVSTADTGTSGTWTGANATWVQITGAGTTVLVAKDGSTAITITTDAAEPNAVIPGKYAGFTSTTATRVRMGTGLVPRVVVPSTGVASGTTIADAGNFTAQTTVEGALQEIYQDLETAQGFLVIDLKAAILAAGTPMAAWANNSASNPGITLDNSKAVGIRWNNNATQVAIWSAVDLPADLDITKAASFVVLASKSGATSGDATTFTITAFAQVAGALEDAGSDLGGTTSALVGAATAKTVAKLTLAVTLTTATPFPARLSVSIKPTDGTLGTDDAMCNLFGLVYTRKLRTS